MTQATHSGVGWWISVEESLPEEGEEVLVWDAEETFCFGFLMRSAWVTVDDGSMCSLAATHWMPLPPPPAKRA